MKLATVLTPLSEENLALSAQCGVQGVTIRYPGPGLDDLLAAKQKIEDHGMEVVAIEGFLPIENIKTGTDQDGNDIRAFKDLIRHMGQAGIPVLCYNFMAGTDWVRTRIDAEARGGAKVTAFDLVDAEQAVSLNSNEQVISTTSISSDELWIWLERFLREVIPVAEECQVTLAMHPDDPPLPEFHGKSRIMNSVAGFERLISLVPSPYNAICFCMGTFVEMGVDIPTAIRRLGSHIRYVHFRDVEGTADSFMETFHDNGPTNMAAVIRALREINYTGPIRPDHVPQLYGEDAGEPGYTMLGRLFAFGYIRGLLQATETV
ncbi:MAG: mannonate dehydratase [Fuerstiella sp.]|nr:mannonate dehydratase [Fuerstiella sp.]